MKKNIKKIMSLCLAMLLMLSTLAGCGKKEKEIPVPTLVPETQIFEDKYERNAEITDMMTYTLDYIENSKGGLSVATFFDHIKVQVDDWDCVTVGVTPMDEIINIIEASNEKYVKNKTDALIAERQALIDAEYEAEVKKAESKGKTYDKPKKEVRTDDIHFDNPYTYTVSLNNKITDVYKPTLLINPNTYKTLYLNVSKYGIPYVVFIFNSASGVYNKKITQESDWVMNGVQAGNVYNYAVDAKGNVLADYPEFVDRDGMNKAAKQNIFFSGNISMSGEGFNWTSLMTLCNALELTEGSKSHGFVQSSDQNFTYYTINLYTNPFEYNEDALSYQSVRSPYTRLIATFDPLTQVCINWTIDTYGNHYDFEGISHTLSEPIEVNVHEYQVDTNDYESMRQTIKSWLENNAIKTTTAYCATCDDEFFGVVETGMTNATMEIVIDGVTYCTLNGKTNDYGAVYGSYVNKDIIDQAEELEDDAAEELIKQHSKDLYINCFILDENNKILCEFIPSSTLFDKNGNTLYLADYEETEYGYKNARFVNVDMVDQLLMTYIKTCRLDTEQSEEVQNICAESGLLAVREYINNFLAKAEQAQKDHQNGKDESDDQAGSASETIAQTLVPNTDEDVSGIVIKDQNLNILQLTGEQLEQIGFTPYQDSTFAIETEVMNLDGIIYGNDNYEEIRVVDAEDGSIGAISVYSDIIKFYGGLHIGMSIDDAKAVAGDNAKIVEDALAQYLIIKSETSTIIATLGENEVCEIHLFNNSIMFAG